MEVEREAHTNTSRRAEHVHPPQPLNEGPTQRISVPPQMSFSPPHLPIHAIFLHACSSWTTGPWRQRHYDPSQRQKIPNDTTPHPRRLETSILVWETTILQKLPLILYMKILSKEMKFILVVIRKPPHKLTFLLHVSDWNIKDSANQHCHKIPQR
jgi:hypothetical protein